MNIYKIFSYLNVQYVVKTGLMKKMQIDEWKLEFDVNSVDLFLRFHQMNPWFDRVHFRL